MKDAETKSGEELQNFGLVNAVSRMAAMMQPKLLQGPNEKHYRSVQLEEHYTIVGEPEVITLYFSPEDGKVEQLPKKLIRSVVRNWKASLQWLALTVLLYDRQTQWMHSKFRRIITQTLQWVVCLLHK